MKECPDTDAIVSIADALDWDVAEGLHHLQTCDECRARIEALRSTRTALSETEPVDDAVLARIAGALHTEARAERTRARDAHRWASALETVLAAVAAPTVLVASGIEIGSMTACLLTGALGAAFLASGRRLRLYGD
jgi:predicted anti-sigma-YlaC factor YlaD